MNQSSIYEDVTKQASSRNKRRDTDTVDDDFLLDLEKEFELPSFDSLDEQLETFYKSDQRRENRIRPQIDGNVHSERKIEDGNMLNANSRENMWSNQKRQNAPNLTPASEPRLESLVLEHHKYDSLKERETYLPSKTLSAGTTVEDIASAGRGSSFPAFQNTNSHLQKDADTIFTDSSTAAVDNLLNSSLQKVNKLANRTVTVLGEERHLSHTKPEFSYLPDLSNKTKVQQTNTLNLPVKNINAVDEMKVAEPFTASSEGYTAVSNKEQQRGSTSDIYRKQRVLHKDLYRQAFSMLPMKVSLPIQDTPKMNYSKDITRMEKSFEKSGSSASNDLYRGTPVTENPVNVGNREVVHSISKKLSSPSDYQQDQNYLALQSRVIPKSSVLTAKSYRFPLKSKLLFDIVQVLHF
eukprot:jgi/Galph1/3594/GphlegSOOS_G2310.1